MKFDAAKLKKKIILNVPYILVGAIATNIGEAIRYTDGKNATEKLGNFFTVGLGKAFQNVLPSLHPLDILVGCAAGAILWAVMYFKRKNAKKYRHGEEYGSARWGTHADIEPFMDPDFKENVIMTKTESLMMSSRPKEPKYARNKNVLVVGGSGSGKTRYFIKPNLLQMHSSYVVTDPKGTTSVR